MYWLDNNTGITTAPDVPAVISATKRFFTNGGSGVPPSVPEDFWFHMIQEELLGVLTMAGIAPAKGDLNQIAKSIQSIAFSAYPVGAPIPWPTAVPPSGFLAMTGQSFSATTYPKLAQAYPSLVLPDMRGEFVRGFDGGRGVDPGRSILSGQSDQIVSHSHDLTHAKGANPGGVLASASAYAAQFFTTAADLWQRPPGTGWTGGATGLTTTVSTGGAESRPRNIAFYYIVRAA
ncbi:phage tail protein [Aeromonas dhakensis]|uniref:phage tail protein n=1 Tax=Aeromonas dhakensis TaxID=196024 RepID=UPI000F888449|nr:phage tail protein [Aeromonas dhakensis]MDH0176381.1 phage tail protein [Aeromonas dhakensis]RUQ10719.1 integrase [Aeromonas dhakensis]